MPTILETPRLLIRHQVLSDLDDLWALYQNPKITKYILDAPRAREEVKEQLELPLKKKVAAKWAIPHLFD